MPKYKRIGGGFRVSRKLQYDGDVVASEEAFFLFSDAAPGGAVGGVLQAVLGGDTLHQHHAMEYDYCSLPVEVTSHVDWPLKRRKTGSVLVVPRSSIDRISYSYLTTYDLHCGEWVYGIDLKILGRKGVLRFLSEAGWDTLRTTTGSKSLVKQLAPLIGIVVGCSVGAVVYLAVGVPMIGVFPTPMFIGIGLLVGFLAGSLLGRHKDRQTSADGPSP